jgi:uncharacterized damage-inducible protein DinB
MTRRPSPSDYASFYETYVRLVPDGDIADLLARQIEETLPVYRRVSEEQSRFRYEPGKWSIRQVLAHVCDAERVFAYRALAFARGETQPLPGFDQNVWMGAAGADEREWSGLLEDLSTIRAATLSLFRRLDDAALARRGIASGNPVSVQALGFIIAGHERHHLGVLEQRYLAAAGYPGA